MKTLYAYIDAHKEAMIEDLKTLAKIPSISDNREACIEVLELALKKGTEAGFQATNYDNWVGSLKYDCNAKDTIGILAHLDVVPVDHQWTITKPFEPIVRDGILYGRGVSDNKAGAIAGLYIQKALKENNIQLNHNIELLLGTNEETGMSDVIHYVSKGYPIPKFTFVPDASFPGVAGEFGRLRFILTSKDVLSEDFVDLYAGSAFNIVPNRASAIISKKSNLDLTTLPKDFEIIENEDTYTITALGVTCHAAGPESGINAIKVLTSGLLMIHNLKHQDKAILTFLDHVNQDYYGTFLNIASSDKISGTTVCSGTVLKYDQGHLSILNDCRYCVTMNGDDLEKEIEKVVSKGNFILTMEEKTYGSHIDPNGPLVETINKVYEDYTGQTKAIKIGKGGTYVGQLPNAFATGCVYLKDFVKPDDIPEGHGSAHQPDEMLPIDGFIEGVKLLITMIIEIDKVL